MRLINRGFVVLSALLFTLGNIARADSHGVSGFSGNPETNSGADCIVCHLRAPTKPVVTLSGPTLVNAGQTYRYNVKIEGGVGVVAGVNISTARSFGLLEPVAGDLSLIKNELVHSAPKKMVLNKAVFGFNWTAPLTNRVAGLFASGLSAEGNHTLLGDNAANDSLFVKVVNGVELPPPPRAKAPVPIALDLYVDGLQSPLEITHAKDNRLFILEQSGTVRIAKGPFVVLPTPFLDISGRIAGSFGLIGLAFHPNYKTNGYFYVHYVYTPSGTGLSRSRISRFQRGIDPDIANPNSEVVIMEYAENNAGTEHFGGDLHFGRDGLLYVMSGDSNLADRAQNRLSPLGKLMRIDVNGAPTLTNAPDCDISGKRNYRIPPGNMFSDGKKGLGCDEIYAMGFRNPWNFSFDRLTGDLWISDVGDITAEEINFIPAGLSGGLNFGWPCYEAFGVLELGTLLTCNNKSFMFPVHAPLQKDKNFSVMGGYVYRGSRYPRLKGQYFFTDFFNTSIRAITGTSSDPIVKEVLAAGNINFPVSFGEDYLGELYVVSYGGAVYRIIDPTVF